MPNHIDRSRDAGARARAATPRDLDGRSMIVDKTDPLPVECVVRGYVAGSAWKDYKATGTVCGIALPEGAPGVRPPRASRSSRPRPRRRRATTRTSPSTAWRRSWAATAPRSCADLTLDLYTRARAHAEARGIILADTKLEFGRPRRARGVDRRGLHPGLVALLAAGRLRARAGRSRASTSSSCATTSRASRGTSGRRPLPCRPTSSSRTREKYLEAYARLTGRRRRRRRRTGAGSPR